MYGNVSIMRISFLCRLKVRKTQEGDEFILAFSESLFLSV